jgi:hypothetical protein
MNRATNASHVPDSRVQLQKLAIGRDPVELVHHRLQDYPVELVRHRLQDYPVELVRHR